MNERRVLENWKAIASYLGRTEKTCRKWEHELGLPIHRLDKSVKAHVFAYADELDRWKAEKLKVARARKVGRLLGVFELSHRTRFWLIAASSLAFLVIAGLLVRQITIRGKSAGSQAAKGIAIMPFDDLSPGKEYEYLCDGMVDALINALGSLEGLRVPARTSSFYFKGKNTPPQEIGKKLNVDYVLGASVQAEGDKLRVIPQLIKVADGYQIWSEKYDRSREDIFTVEDDIARGITKALEIKVLGVPGVPMVKPGTQNLEAYNLYLKGQHFSKKGRLFYKQAIEYFEKAVEKDPNYAAAYANIAGGYYTSGSVGSIPTHEAYLKARQAAVRALEIDGRSVLARRMLASMKLTYEWDFPGAEHDIRSAIRDDPSDAGLHACYGDLLSAWGRHKEAIEEGGLAAELNPLSPGFINGTTMASFYRARKYELAMERLNGSLGLDPYFIGTHINLIRVYLAMGRYEDARAANKRRKEILGVSDKPNDDVWSALVYARAGYQCEARRILAGIKDKMKESFIPTSSVVLIHAALGDKDEAFVWLERAFQQRDYILYTMKVEPLFDPLRSDPRFKDLLRRVGLEK